MTSLEKVFSAFGIVFGGIILIIILLHFILPKPSRRNTNEFL